MMRTRSELNAWEECGYAMFSARNQEHKFTGTSGTTLLPKQQDRKLIYLTAASTGSGAPVVLASAMTSVIPAECSGASIAALGVVNAAGYSATSISPGSFVSLFGANLTSAI